MKRVIVPTTARESTRAARERRLRAGTSIGTAKGAETMNWSVVLVGKRNKR